MNTRPKSKTFRLFVVLGTALALSGYVLGPAPGQKKKEITIRNMTREAVSYSVTPAVPKGKTNTRRLEPSDIHQFPGEIELDITFKSAGKIMTYRLTPGRHYSFRYDESNNLSLYLGSHGRSDAVDLAPFVTTPMSVVEKMLELARIDKKDVVYDLGSGDGRIVIAAAKEYGARGVGIELDPENIKKSWTAARRAGIEQLVEFRMEDATKADISEATVVTLYLLPESNELLRGQLEKQLRPGTRVVSHNYLIPGWEDKEIASVNVKTETGEEHEIYVYRR